MKTVKTFIEELGTITEVAKQCGRHPSAVVFWKQNNSIPISNWPVIIKMAHEKEIECNPEILLRMCLARPKKTGT